MLDRDGFRPNVGIILLNQKNQVFWGKRIRTHSWQFPQGGIDRGETPEQAMYRELHEEVGLLPSHVRVVARTRDWLRYEVPDRYIRRDARGHYKGQKQIWYLLQLLGHDWDLNLRATNHPEFDAWRWNDYWVPLDVVVEFKRGVYEMALRELARYLPRNDHRNRYLRSGMRTRDADPMQQASTWLLDFGVARASLVISSETWRGFSGEGQALASLMRAALGGGAVLARVRAALHWQSAIDPEALAAELDTDAASVLGALRILGASGLVGFDVGAQCYFHRVLPFDLSAMEDMHPRLADARRLLDAGAVAVVSPLPFEASVVSGGTVHRVREVEGELHCTCPWFARHQGQRGPCKHVLAASAARAATH